MHISIKGHELDTSDIMILVTPILAALSLTLLVALHGGVPVTDSSINNKRFITMPRNCYLKLP